MYTPDDVFARISEHQVGFLILGGLCMICALTWYVESVRLAQRDRVISMPIFTTVAWFGHDLSYVLRFNNWFHTYHFWFFEAFWVFMVILVILEVVWIAQILAFGRREFFPNISPPVFTLGLVGALIASALWWETLKWNLNDPLYIISMTLTVMLYAATSMMLTQRRGSQLGQSRLLLLSATGCSASFSIATILWLGPAFRDPRWIGVTVATVVWCLYSTNLWSRMPKTAAASGDAIPPLEAIPHPQSSGLLRSHTR